MDERLHKLLAHAGFGSRRACEKLIEARRVTVNGRVASVGDKADAGVDDIRVDSRRVKPERKVYYLLNKPPGYICTNSDPQGRRKVSDLLVGVRERVYPVGRLDADSRGLLVLTNDGELAARLTHPRYEVPKTYEAEVDGCIGPEDVEKMIPGVWLSEGRTGSARVRILRRGRARSLIEITLREGRNRQVRRILARRNHKVRKLTRTRIGRLTLRGLGPGKFRKLTPAEVRGLFRETEKPAAAKPAGKGRGGRPTTRGKPGAAKTGGQRAGPAKRSGPKSKRSAKRSHKGRRVYDFTA